MLFSMLFIKSLKNHPLIDNLVQLWLIICSLTAIIDFVFLEGLSLLTTELLQSGPYSHQYPKSYLSQVTNQNVGFHHSTRWALTPSVKTSSHPISLAMMSTQRIFKSQSLAWTLQVADLPVQGLPFSHSRLPEAQLRAWSSCHYCFPSHWSQNLQKSTFEQLPSPRGCKQTSPLSSSMVLTPSPSVTPLSHHSCEVEHGVANPRKPQTSSQRTECPRLQMLPFFYLGRPCDKTVTSQNILILP